MTLLITLSTAGGDTGPFNLYSNVDGFTSAFEVGVAKIDLLMGYISYTVPDGTTVIRVMSDSVCKNYIDLTVNVTTTTTSSSTTEPPIPPFPTDCYCFNLTGVGEYVITWRDCLLVDHSFIGSNFDINICAQLGTIQTDGGDGSLVISNSGNTCITEASCPTTTTTTTIPPYSFELTYDDTSCSNACAGLVTTTYYSADPVLGAASVLYTDSGLTTPAVNGYYSDLSDCFTITDGIGTIDSVSSCSL
jgi:hypothetical protein